jgi:ATP-binding cassette subfamily B protein
MRDRHPLADVTWPAARLGEAITIVSRRTGLGDRTVSVKNPDRGTLAAGEPALGRWLTEASSSLGIDAQDVDAPYRSLDMLLRRACPAIVRLGGGSAPSYLLVLASRRRYLRVLGPDLGCHRILRDTVSDIMTAPIERDGREYLDRLARLGIDVSAPKLRRSLLLERFGSVRIDGCVLLRLPSAAALPSQLRHSRLPSLAAGLILSHTAQYLLMVTAWGLIGSSLLNDSLRTGWFGACALLLISAVPFQILASWCNSRLGVEIGARLKRRVLSGALGMDAERVKCEGVGRLLGRVIEAEVIESIALSGAVLGLTGTTELAIAAVVLMFGAQPRLHPVMLVVLLAMSVALAIRFTRSQTHWSRARLAMTNALVEKIIGHRTRRAQESVVERHDDEDRQLGRYVEVSKAVDGAAVGVFAIPRIWLGAAVASLLLLLAQNPAPATSVAISLGGILLAYRALSKLVPVVWSSATAVIAWREVRPLIRQARFESSSAEALGLRVREPGERQDGGDVVLEAKGLSFKYRPDADPVLHGCDLQIRGGDRILIQGASGSGKSTLGSLLAGLRTPNSGLLLLRGLDRATLGDRGWRHRVVSAPQFHENYVLTGTFAFNALMGRGWPPAPGDLKRADEVCRALGLGDLLDRMPAGILQMVGDMGWQLSHGERSRLFMARTLLQRSDLVILDETFSALDPYTLQQCATYVCQHAPALVVIAHP